MTAERREQFLDISRPDLGDEEIEEILDTIRSGWLISGPKVQRLQQDLSDYIGAPHVRCLSSCTAGLMLAHARADACASRRATGRHGRDRRAARSPWADDH